MTNIINDSITDEVLQELENQNPYNIIRNNTGEIEMVDYNSLMANIYLRKITANIQDGLNSLEKKDNIVLEISIFSLFNNP